MQLNTQLGVVSEKTEHKPEWAVISYVNCSFYDDTVEFVHHFDAAAFEFTKARAAKILAATAADELRPEGYIAGGHECETCPFTQACGVIRHAVPTGPPAEPLDPQALAELIDLAREVAARRALTEAATCDQREAENDLKNRLRAKGHRSVADGDVRITWSAVKGRPSFDWVGIRTAAAAAGVDLSEYETVGAPTDRLLVSLGETANCKKEKHHE